MRPVVKIDEDLLEIMPSFINLTDKDCESMQTAIKVSDWGEIKSIAHTLKGDCGGYGFDYLSEISKIIETHAEKHDMAGVMENFKEFEVFWAEVKKEYTKLSA